MRVLLIEDDPVLGESLKEFLEREGCEVRWIQDDREFYDPTVAEAYDVVVLDLMLRFGSGEDILRKIRDYGIDTPVLILTAKRSMRDKEVCFGLGADDYLTKPFDPKELMLRIKALLRRVQNKKIVKIGDTEIHLERLVLKKGNIEIKLTKTAWELLLLLLKNKGKVVSNETILNCIWEDRPVGTEVVRAYIKELRKVLPPGSIKTFRGIGYMLDEV
ncbi:response regulator transcription factor [Hydrogenivirga sp. 128-5-R1-1]|uniref:response regulator transcription factor n=1 Tax=Hydrogenivirga sp. 128-5-R1-1 TaxID=392423 RepID=UPI00015F2F67|nr:response regulator transcription factor [Hydrogenivirga sp. 128-5-R1-1]EDP74481.1 transcriptional regulator [Hydrogenivirga sp. 128-5-R1-1]